MSPGRDRPPGASYRAGAGGSGFRALFISLMLLALLVVVVVGGLKALGVL